MLRVNTWGREKIWKKKKIMRWWINSRQNLFFVCFLILGYVKQWGKVREKSRNCQQLNDETLRKYAVNPNLVCFPVPKRVKVSHCKASRKDYIKMPIILNSTADLLQTLILSLLFSPFHLSVLHLLSLFLYYLSYPTALSEKISLHKILNSSPNPVFLTL